MIRDANNSDLTFEGQYDFCIVGAGPAGMSIALKLAESGFRIALLEAGGLEITSESQDLYQGKLLGRDYVDLDVARLRYFGGTTGHWGGQCLRLDDHDFETRNDIPLSGWPIRYDDLKPYEDGANGILNLTSFGKVRRSVDNSLDVVTQRWSTERAFYDLKNIEPMHFGDHFQAELKAAKTIDVVLNANVTGLSMDTTTGRISSAKVENYSGQTRIVQAKHFILAMGAIEVSRFLLQLNAAWNNSFGNQGDMVGRCFMEHPIKENGTYFITRRLFSNSRYWEFERLLRRQKPERAISPTPQFQLSNGIMNSTIHLGRLHRKPLNTRDTEGSEFIKSLKYDEDYFSVGDSYSMGEQAPNPASRILLVEDRDRFGQRKPGLDWQLLPIDLKTMQTSTLEVARMLIRSGLGRMQINPELWAGESEQAFDYSWHHMGGARMSETSETGVVDRNCNVHGSENLYVAGSGIFATSGHANPTYSIVQFALRLADHLKNLT